MLLNFIYPPVCGICGNIDSKELCSKCEDIIKKYEINKIIDYRNDKDKYFDYHVKTYRYDEIIRKKIIDYKFNEDAYLNATFEKMILKSEKIYRFLENYDIILYVPMYKQNRFARGYNQSELIAKKIGKTLGVHIERNNLIKIRKTEKQSTLDKKERETNIKNAFKILKPDRLKNKKVILFDDIYTTGSTVNECSRVLREAGVKEIAILTIAVD